MEEISSGRLITTTVRVNQAAYWTAPLELGSWRDRNLSVAVVIHVSLTRATDDTYETA
jgi:hypothetical protein